MQKVKTELKLIQWFFSFVTHCRLFSFSDLTLSCPALLLYVLFLKPLILTPPPKSDPDPTQSLLVCCFYTFPYFIPHQLYLQSQYFICTLYYHWSRQSSSFSLFEFSFLSRCRYLQSHMSVNVTEVIRSFLTSLESSPINLQNIFFFYEKSLFFELLFLLLHYHSHHAFSRLIHFFIIFIDLMRTLPFFQLILIIFIPYKQFDKNISQLIYIRKNRKPLNNDTFAIQNQQLLSLIQKINVFVIKILFSFNLFVYFNVICLANISSIQYLLFPQFRMLVKTLAFSKSLNACKYFLNTLTFIPQLLLFCYKDQVRVNGSEQLLIESKLEMLTELFLKLISLKYPNFSRQIYQILEVQQMQMPLLLYLLKRINSKLTMGIFLLIHDQTFVLRLYLLLMINLCSLKILPSILKQLDQPMAQQYDLPNLRLHMQHYILIKSI